MAAALAPITAASSGALQFELQKARHELSNCVNCDSAKTSSGQTQIATLQAEVRGIEQRIEKVGQAHAGNGATAAAGAPSPLGNFIDVYA